MYNTICTNVVCSDPDWAEDRDGSVSRTAGSGIRIGGRHYNLREPRKINYCLEEEPGQLWFMISGSSVVDPDLHSFWPAA
jgi:hypothetical protein